MTDHLDDLVREIHELNWKLARTHEEFHSAFTYAEKVAFFEARKLSKKGDYELVERMVKKLFRESVEVDVTPPMFPDLANFRPPLKEEDVATLESFVVALSTADNMERMTTSEQNELLIASCLLYQHDSLNPRHILRQLTKIWTRLNPGEPLPTLQPRPSPDGSHPLQTFISRLIN